MVAADHDGQDGRPSSTAVVAMEIAQLLVLCRHGQTVEVSPIPKGLDVTAEDEDVGCLSDMGIEGVY